MAEIYRYAAFISYSSKDATFAHRLHSALESYGIPSSLGRFDLIGGGGKQNRIYPVFRDREELSAGHLGDQIEANLKASAALVVVCSPNGAASPWVQKEIEFFAAQGRQAKIFAIIPDTAPLVDEHGADCTQSCFPPAFCGDALSGDKLEPLAADARKGKDGFRNAWLKIVACMIGVSPGQILDRDRRRRREQVVRATVLWALVILSAGYAYTQRETLEPWLVSWVKYKRFAHTSEEMMNGPSGPARSFQDCETGSNDCPVMIAIPQGTFVMGDAPQPADLEPWDNDLGGPSTEPDRRRRVAVASFAVSRTEITFAEWRRCFDAGACGNEMPDRSGWPGDNRPVINVSWDDAQKYAAWLSRMTGHEYRLLTDEEWEYAARGLTSADDPRNSERWSFGADVTHLGAYAWFAENAADETCPDRCTHPVAMRRPNPFGLYDMHGNVMEWVEDCLPLAGRGAGVDPCAPISTTERLYRKTRGGAWYDVAWFVRSAGISSENPGYRRNYLGFRIARTL